MNAENSHKESQTEPASLEGLIRREWDIIGELQKMLKDPELTVREKTQVATVFAYHANNLSRMLAQKGDRDPFDDQNLGDYVLGVEPRIARRLRRDFRTWKRTLSLRRY